MEMNRLGSQSWEGTEHPDPSDPQAKLRAWPSYRARASVLLMELGDDEGRMGGGRGLSPEGGSGVGQVERRATRCAFWADSAHAPPNPLCLTAPLSPFLGSPGPSGQLQVGGLPSLSSPWWPQGILMIPASPEHLLHPRHCSELSADINSLSSHNSPVQQILHYYHIHFTSEGPRYREG